MASFLLEIGVEEIPDWMITPALTELGARFEAAFKVFGGSALITKATPRRLVLLVENMDAQAPDVESLVQGPYLSAGAKAAEGFARKQGTTVDQLPKTQDAKGERYVFAQLVKGQSAMTALTEKLPEVIAGLHFPKAMYWTGKGGVRFIRPIRWIVALLDDEVVPFDVADVKSGNATRGHRVLGAQGPQPVTIANYFETLRANFVIVDAEERRARIEAGLGQGVEKDEGLLTTLVYLTEYPTPINGSFDAAYLELPKEILSTAITSAIFRFCRRMVRLLRNLLR
jgi:glycyl-tRNA synthetase beta chain